MSGEEEKRKAGRSFPEKVFSSVSRIPKGKVSTYKEIAKAIGKPKAVRAVGQVLKVNKNPVKIPCYRVVCSDGSIGGYCGSEQENINRKVELLKRDGIEVGDGRISIEKHLYRLNG